MSLPCFLFCCSICWGMNVRERLPLVFLEVRFHWFLYLKNYCSYLVAMPFQSCCFFAFRSVYCGWRFAWISFVVVLFCLGFREILEFGFSCRMCEELVSWRSLFLVFLLVPSPFSFVALDRWFPVPCCLSCDSLRSSGAQDTLFFVETGLSLSVWTTRQQQLQRIPRFLCAFFVLPSLNFVRVHPVFRAQILLENQAKKFAETFAKRVCISGSSSHHSL